MENLARGALINNPPHPRRPRTPWLLVNVPRCETAKLEWHSTPRCRPKSSLFAGGGLRVRAGVGGGGEGRSHQLAEVCSAVSATASWFLPCLLVVDENMGGTVGESNRCDGSVLKPYAPFEVLFTKAYGTHFLEWLDLHKVFFLNPPKTS